MKTGVKESHEPNPPVDQWPTGPDQSMLFGGSMKTKAPETLRDLKAKCLALEQENLRLHRKIAKLEAQVVSARSGMIARLENTPPDKLTDEELTYLIRKGQKKRSTPKSL